MSPGLERIRSQLEQLEQTQWSSAEQLQRGQTHYLAQLVEHARANVPYYAETLASFRLPPQAPLDADAWRALPLLTKAAVRSEGERLKSRVEHGTTIPRATSGSTGEPLRLVKDKRHWFVFAAIKLRFLRSLQTDFRGKLLEIRGLPASHARDAVLRHRNWEGPTHPLFETGERVRANCFLDSRAQLELMVREQPQYLTINPSNLRLLLREFRLSGQRIPSLHYVLTMGEQFDPGLRQECREVLGVPMFDIYGSAEADFIALQCPAHECYHVQSELNLVEVLSADGRPCRPGETGRVVLTPLHQRTMPLLRYDTGDYAEVGEACACGRGLPVLKRVLGKQFSLLTRSSGEQQMAVNGSRVFAKIEAVKQYQLAQTGLTEVEARIVAARPLDEGERARIVQGLGNQLGAEFSVRIKLVDSIPRTPGGKYMEFIVDMPGSGSA